MKFIYKVCGKAALFFYIFTLYRFWHLCQYGGLKRHIPLLIFGSVGCIVMSVLWLVSRTGMDRSAVGIGSRILLLIEIIIFAGSTMFFSEKIISSGVRYQGALSWKIDEWTRKKEIKLEHDNLFQDGADGFLQDMDQVLDLSEELYVENKCQIRFDQQGRIQSIYGFLYGKDKNGEKRTYLIDYDVQDSEYLTVWLDGNANGTYEKDDVLAPMFTIINQSDWTEKVSSWAEEMETEQIYELLYIGRRTFYSSEGLQYVAGDVDGDGIESGMRGFSQLSGGGAVVGYEVSLSIPALDNMTPVRYMMEPEYITPAELEQENTLEQSDTAIKAESWTIDQSDGSMYFFLDEKTGWRMVITDAAAGSRFYELDCTTDGGKTWERINKDPFGGSIGVTEGLIFYDESFGIAGLTNASGSSSKLYLTRDGGKSFEKISLPMESVTELPELADEIGYTIEDYDYLNMPEIDGNRLKITVTTESTEQEGLVFQSEDQGTTWICIT